MSIVTLGLGGGTGEGGGAHTLSATLDGVLKTIKATAVTLDGILVDQVASVVGTTAVSMDAEVGIGVMLSASLDGIIANPYGGRWGPGEF